MAGQRIRDYLNQFQLPPGLRSWWPEALVICAVLGGIYGGSLGAAVGAVPGAATLIEMAAAIMALICGVPGARLGAFIGVLHRTRFGRLLFGIFAAIVGAILGGFLATMVLLAFGAVLGAIGGWLFVQAVRRQFLLRRILGGIAGAVLGMFLGAVLWALWLNPASALADATQGFAVGAVVGPLLLLMLIAALNSLPPARSRNRGDYIDAAFQGDDETENDNRSR